MDDREGMRNKKLSESLNGVREHEHVILNVQHRPSQVYRHENGQRERERDTQLHQHRAARTGSKTITCRNEGFETRFGT